jgi:hypothetical protein
MFLVLLSWLPVLEYVPEKAVRLIIDLISPR